MDHWRAQTSDGYRKGIGTLTHRYVSSHFVLLSQITPIIWDDWPLPPRVEKSFRRLSEAGILDYLGHRLRGCFCGRDCSSGIIFSFPVVRYELLMVSQ